MKVKSDNLPSSLMHSVVNDYTSGALIEFGESMMDNLTENVIQNDIVTNIPVISGTERTQPDISSLR